MGLRPAHVSLIDAVTVVTTEAIQGLAHELFSKTLIARTLPEHPVDIMSVDTPSKSDAEIDHLFPQPETADSLGSLQMLHSAIVGQVEN